MTRTPDLFGSVHTNVSHITICFLPDHGCCPTDSMALLHDRLFVLYVLHCTYLHCTVLPTLCCQLQTVSVVFAMNEPKMHRAPDIGDRCVSPSRA